MSTWGKGIVEAATLASQVCGFSAETIRRWGSSYFISIGAFPGPPENIDNEFIYHELSSDRGHGVGNESLIIHDEEFQIKAREFVHSNAYKKGEPNLTTRGFRDWIQTSFNVSV